VTDVHGEVTAAVGAIREMTRVDRHDVAVVLGSGLGSFAERRDGAVAVSYRDLPGFPVPAAEGHSGTMVSAQLGPNRVLMLSGRGHAYEGHDLSTVVLPVRAAVAAGCRTVVLTNAAGGIDPALAPGDLTVIRDHLNLTARNPLAGPNDDRLGPRFPDMTDVYSVRLRRIAGELAATHGWEAREVVYAWWLGPSYETPAEIRMIRTLGADVVGMSTVPEAIAARHMGADVAGLSLVTNRAAGLGAGPLSATEVLEVAAEARPRVERYLAALLAHPGLAAPS
jgi:purine-nucleoside phosphorylase